MQTHHIFLKSDLALLRSLIREFVTRRQTRKILLQLDNDQKKDLGIAPSKSTQISHLLNPPW
jgi:uncharacterized protein YjiS (DUF1127 family)